MEKEATVLFVRESSVSARVSNSELDIKMKNGGQPGLRPVDMNWMLRPGSHRPGTCGLRNGSPSPSFSGFPFVFVCLFLTSLLEYNCFTMVC